MAEPVCRLSQPSGAGVRLRSTTAGISSGRACLLELTKQSKLALAARAAAQVDSRRSAQPGFQGSSATAARSSTHKHWLVLPKAPFKICRSFADGSAMVSFPNEDQRRAPCSRAFQRSTARTSFRLGADQLCLRSACMVQVQQSRYRVEWKVLRIRCVEPPCPVKHKPRSRVDRERGARRTN